MDSGRVYELTIRTPDAQRRARRRLRIKRGAIAAGMVAALFAPSPICAVAHALSDPAATPATIARVAPAFCAGQWECQ